MDSVRVDLFCEDRGHEQFVTALLKRLRKELDFPFHVSTISARGGKSQAISEFRRYQRALAEGHLTRELPDLLVLVVDTNCESWGSVRRQLTDAVDDSVFPHAVLGCPEPHVERWCIADPQGFADAVGVEPPADPGKCEKGFYKRLLRNTIRTAGHPILTDEMEFAPEIVQHMDLFRAGKSQNSFRHFVNDLRTTLNRLRQHGG